MVRDEHDVVFLIFKHFQNKADQTGHIPIQLQAPSLVGTTQDDPFDNFILDEIRTSLPSLDTHSAGKLTTPDIVMRDPASGTIVGFEVKKLIQQPNGADPRGLTMDYNSSLPCGRTQIKVNGSVETIPCYYFFALLSNDSSAIKTLIVMDGDFLNNDFELHKRAKIENKSDYGHGPYDEGSVRRRAMYTYPNPLNHKLDCFFERKTLVIKWSAAQARNLTSHATHRIERVDNTGKTTVYAVLDLEMEVDPQDAHTINDLFKPCKDRKPKERKSASMPSLEV